MKPEPLQFKRLCFFTGVILLQTLAPANSFAGIFGGIFAGTHAELSRCRTSLNQIRTPRHFYRPGINFSKFIPAPSAGEKLKNWLATHRHEFLAHGIWEDNVQKTLRSGKVIPAELILRETGSLSFESTRHYGRRSAHTLRSQEIHDLFDAVGPIQACTGVAFLKVERVPGTQNQYVILRKEGTSASWELLKLVSLKVRLVLGQTDTLPTPRTGPVVIPVTLNDQRFVSGLLDSAGNPLPIELPVLNCSIAPHHSEPLLRLRGRRARSESFGIHPEYYLNFSRELKQRERLIDYADRNHLPKEAVFVAHDEYHGRTADQQLLGAIPQFKQEVIQFVSEFKKLATQGGISNHDAESFLQRIGFWSHRFPAGDQLDELLWAVRAALYGGIAVQSEISLSCNGLAPYGKVFVVVGDPQKASIGAPREINTYDFPQLAPFHLGFFELVTYRLGEVPLFECRSQHPLHQQGKFAEIPLTDSDVLILGPRSVIADIPEVSKYNVIYTDELTAEEKRLIPAFGIDFELMSPVPSDQHPLE